MKKIILVIFGLVIFPTACNHIIGYFSPSPEGKTTKEPETVEEKHLALLRFADTLAAENIIAVSPEKFAGFMLCVFYAESGLQTNAPESYDDAGSQGLFQVTAKTRRLLGIPDNINAATFSQQLEYFKRYLVASKQGNKIQQVYDLHVLNFSPYKVGKDFICKAKGPLVWLDLNSDGDVTANDMRIFISKRCKENPYVWNVFQTLQ